MGEPFRDHAGWDMSLQTKPPANSRTSFTEVWGGASLVYACTTCGATVAKRMFSTHRDWHALLDGPGGA